MNKDGKITYFTLQSDTLVRNWRDVKYDILPIAVYTDSLQSNCHKDYGVQGYDSKSNAQVALDEVKLWDNKKNKKDRSKYRIVRRTLKRTTEEV